MFAVIPAKCYNHSRIMYHDACARLANYFNPVDKYIHLILYITVAEESFLLIIRT